MLTFERANELFHYNPSSGRLTWKKITTNRVKVGDDAGSLCKTTGYTNVVVDGRGYTVHRIAILLSTGVYGRGVQVDHINHDRSDNRIENLRVTSHMKNMQNQKKSFFLNIPMLNFYNSTKIMNDTYFYSHLKSH